MTHYFKSQGVRIAYDDVGKGAPIVLLHGFSASRRLNWKLPGWYDTLNAAGYRVIAFDARGHGQSDKPSDVESYRPEGIAGDAIRLMDHLGIRKASLLGYSMGGRNAAWLLANYPNRFDAVVIGGTGLNLLPAGEARRWAARGYALTADNEKTESLAIPAMVPLYHRATRRGGRMGALAACLLGAFPNMSAGDFARVAHARAGRLRQQGHARRQSGAPCGVDPRRPGRARARPHTPGRRGGSVLQGRGDRLPRPPRLRPGQGRQPPSCFS